MATTAPFPTWLPDPGAPHGVRQRHGPDAAPRPDWLRPLSLGEILDRAFHLLRRNYRALAPAVLLFSVPCSVLSAFAARSLSGGLTFLSFGSVAPAGSGASSAWLAVPYLVAVLAPALVAGPVCRIAAADILGRPLERSAAIRGGLTRLPACLAAGLLVTGLSLVGTLLCTLPGLVLWSMFRLTLPAVVIEDRGPLAAMGRSWRLASSRFWPVVGLTVLVVLVNYAVGQLLNLVPAGVAALVGLHWGFLLLAAGSAVVATVTWSYTLIAVTLMYFDLRVRKEGLDLALQLDALSL